MKNIFLDTNIILDYLTMRQPFFSDAEAIFLMADQRKILLHSSSLSFSIIYYVLRKFQTRQQLLQTLPDFAQATKITGVDEMTVHAALRSDFNDFEDALQYFSALHFGNMDAIITRNAKDFTGSTIPVFSPADFIAAMRKP
jgi:predicted nucleic acid-binding protein